MIDMNLQLQDFADNDSLLPMVVEDRNGIVEVFVCDLISGGAAYVLAVGIR